MPIGTLFVFLFSFYLSLCRNNSKTYCLLIECYKNINMFYTLQNRLPAPKDQFTAQLCSLDIAVIFWSHVVVNASMRIHAVILLLIWPLQYVENHTF
jgi:hypothetical protein